MANLEMERVLEARGPAGALVLTDEEVQVLGGGKRAAVRVRVGEREARLRLAVMGGENLIGMSKAARAELGVEVGQRLAATITLDEAPREVSLPAELSEALAADPAAQAGFDALPLTARKDYATWVDSAKRPETRAARVTQSLDLLREGKRRTQ